MQSRFHLQPYAELHCLSNFSFLKGASHPAELIDRAVRLGYSALALTDECSLAGVVRAHSHLLECHPEGALHLVVGSEMRLTPPTVGPVDEFSRGERRLVLLAQTRRGYGNLSHWITVARRRAAKGSYLAHPGDVEGKVPNAPTLTGLPDCLALLVPDASQPFELVFAHAMWLKTWFQDRAALALELLHRAGDDALLHTLRRVSQLTGLPIVAAGGVLMHVRSRKPLLDVLTATRLNLPVAQCGWQLHASAEAHLRSRARLSALYEAEWLQNTVRWAARCHFSLSELKYEYPREIVPPGETPTSHLRKLTREGAARRFPGGLPKGTDQDGDVAAQIETELALIQQLAYEPYFLTVADIVAWAREQKILCQGRGSAANSLVCYCLGVTEVHPREAKLLFERFISVERKEPPDIDIDFEHQRREEVIQYIYGKYGRHRAALTAVVTTYRPRSAVRDVGRALGIDPQRIDAVAKGQQWWDGRGINPERLRESGFDPESPVARLWGELTQQLIGFPRHLSQHPGGFVIARDQIEQLVPVENAAMDNRQVVQWDKDDLDALGLIKVDILALGMLSALRRAVDVLGSKLGRPFTVQDVPIGDPATYDMICKADTIGVFQIESRAQMSMLPRLQPRCYYDLVVEVAIVRPGPIQGGMVHPYLRNRSLRDDELDCPPALLPALRRTRGVPIFQEQVMQIAMIAADFTGGEADQLRRAMAAWKRKGGLGPFHEKLVNGMARNGYERDYAERIFKQIEGFGEYGFPESHAAGFALLAYVSSWIKCHHPDVFLAALLNSQPMGFYAPAQLVRDAREHGVRVLPVDVTVSGWESVLVMGEEAGVQGREPSFDTSGRSNMPPQGEWERVHEQVHEQVPKRMHEPKQMHEPVPKQMHEQVREEGREGLAEAACGADSSQTSIPVRPEPVEGAAQDEAGLASFDRLRTVGDTGPGQVSLHESNGSPPPAHKLVVHVPPPCPVRLGFNRIAGFPEEAARRIDDARRHAPFCSVEDLARRAALSAHELDALARADALHALSGHRHQAVWQVAGIDTRPTALLHVTRVHEAPVELQAPQAAEDTLADYQALGLSLKHHPLALLRDALSEFKVQPAAVLRTYPSGRLARASGLVTHRQRPETAKGTIFITLEDETGAVNVVVWPRVAEAQRRPLLSATLLTVYGQWQRQGEGDRAVMHLVATRLIDHSALLNGLVTHSRDFH